ncbi:MAG: glycosyltransferase [Syntrophales bacterium]|nr:glycosyltransferase [Syntrophales bacterium]
MLTLVIPSGAGIGNWEVLKRDIPNLRVLVLMDGSVSPIIPEDLTSERLYVSSIGAGETVGAVLNSVRTPFFLFIKKGIICPRPFFVRRFLQAAESGAGMVYADYIEREASGDQEHPLNDYQLGSIRDDFDLGPVVLYSTEASGRVTTMYGIVTGVEYAGWYDLRLKISTHYHVYHLREFLYEVDYQGVVKKGDSAIFDYVDPVNWRYQEEMERSATVHLKRIGAYLGPREMPPPLEDDRYPVEASVIIPVKNRVQTIADAIRSALMQETDFQFNVIVVDNHSTDGTSDVIVNMAREFPQVIHVIPSRRDLKIGGCWNEAVFSSYCGRFAVQLDSDDVYAGPHVLKSLVHRLRVGNAAMVVGSYTTVDEHLLPIPPGLVQHREWTEENGHNNLLRVNGIGAPRAYRTDIIRRISFPDVGYGEDYAVALVISRLYPIGRIYENLYLCRRWGGNTDANLSILRKNENDAYKDGLRTLEILTRKKMNLMV